MKHPVLTVFAATWLAMASVAQVTDWTQITTATSPSGRTSHAMAYDSARGRVVLFAGSNGLSDTWEYDGVTWTQVTTANSPSARGMHAMVYDSARGKVVMFGGTLNGIYPNDTWEYDGVNWTQMTTVGSPGGRELHAMAYDSTRGKVVVFGGKNVWSPGLLNDTWEYDGVNWIQVTPFGSSPSARQGSAMVYDSARGKVVMFGGNVAANVNDTWEYDGFNWTQMSVGGPGARDMHGMAYDSARGKVEPPRVSRRLHYLRGWSYGTSEQILNGAA